MVDKTKKKSVFELIILIRTSFNGDSHIHIDGFLKYTYNSVLVYSRGRGRSLKCPKFPSLSCHFLIFVAFSYYSMHVGQLM